VALRQVVHSARRVVTFRPESFPSSGEAVEVALRFRTECGFSGVTLQRSVTLWWMCRVLVVGEPPRLVVVQAAVLVAVGGRGVVAIDVASGGVLVVGASGWVMRRAIIRSAAVRPGCGAGGDLVEGHADELRGRDAPHETLDRLEAGEGGGIPFSDHLSTPPHVGSRT